MAAPEKPWYTPMFQAYLCLDVPESVGIPPAALARDWFTLERRVTMEGESFLTKTLPQFGRVFDFALQERSPLAVSGFKKRSRSSALPAFLQALLERVFKDDGHILDEPCIESIKAIRQICYWCKKVEKGFTDEALQIAVTAFKEVDAALPELPLKVVPGLLGRARFVIEWIFRDIPRSARFLPKHGPGAVAWSGADHGKYKLGVSYQELERVFRPIPFMRSLRDASEHPEELISRVREKYGLSRLAFVEKDSSGPRLIGLEPAEYMWCQQALKAWIYRFIEEVCSITMGRVNFTDQSINRDFARDWENWDTLDMSSASDRNSFALVKTLFERTWLWPYLQASRTPGVVLPDGEVLMYKKFAPMGSALCFPVEALTFFALAVASLAKAGMPFLLALKRVYVYGDDLIVPHGYFAAMNQDFEQVGLKFSESKCCVSGKFRESCGLDAFDGVDVTPLRLRKPHLARPVLDLVSMIQHINKLMSKGLRGTAVALKRALLAYSPELRRWSLPYADVQDLPILAWFDPLVEPSVKFFTKNSIVYIRGRCFVPSKEEASQVLDRFFLRCSLASGGPVGEEIHRGSRAVRMLTSRWSGDVHIRTLPYLPAESMSDELVLINKRFSWCALYKAPKIRVSAP